MDKPYAQVITSSINRERGWRLTLKVLDGRRWRRFKRLCKDSFTGEFIGEQTMIKIKLGDRVRDKITGFTGIATARTEWLYGCICITIQGERLEKGVPIEPHTFDQSSLEEVKTSTGIKRDKEDPPAGPRPAVTREKDPV
ncbi:unnamed protein product [marine sediment metagenome]|uniref:Uncharacterized protein n=1 Tax=marine sediment metagenome TaxID=412755 RepID=X0SXY6_9ZZZZ